MITCCVANFFLESFRNLPHTDNDLNLWTNGIWLPARASDALLRTHADACGTETGGYFYDAHMKVFIDFAAIDGVVWVLWQGRRNVHGTTIIRCEGDAMRYGLSTQINQRLDDKVQKAFHKQLMNIKDDYQRAKQHKRRTSSPNLGQKRHDTSDVKDI